MDAPADRSLDAGAPPPGRLAGWQGPALAAALTALVALPQVMAAPVLDRDEARFAQATAQMLEAGDYVNIRFQDAPRDKKPVGIHWLQAAAVAATSSAEARSIAAYRLPSLLGAMLAAWACVWGAGAFLSPGRATLAGLVLGLSAMLSTEAAIAKTDAVLCGAVTLAMAGLARRYLAARGATAPARGARLALWSGMALAVLDKGPVGPMVVGLALLGLWMADRDARWMARLGWGWGLALVLLVVGPWAVAITVATDGAFWTGAVGGDLASKVRGGSEGHGGPPGVHALLAPLLLFPAGFLIPLAAVGAWRKRGDPAVRFALAWLLPSWLVFELLPTKLPHYPLPLYGALAWLAVSALPEAAGGGRRVRWAAAALAVLAGAAFAAAPLLAASRYGGLGSGGWAAASALAALAAAAAGAGGALSGRWVTSLAGALALGGLSHMLLAGGVLPRLDGVWVTRRASTAVAASGLDPRNGVTAGPVAVAGYAEPSIVFRMGTATELATPDDAAQAIAERRPALVEAKVEPAFLAALAAQRAQAVPVARVAGYDYADGRPVTLTLWRAASPTGAPP